MGSSQPRDWTHLSSLAGKYFESERCSIVSNSLQPHGLYNPWNFPGQNTRVGSCSLLQGIFPTQGLNPALFLGRWILWKWKWKFLNHVQLFATPWTIQSMGFSRPEYWSEYPFPYPGDLSNPGIKPRSPTLQADSLPAELQRSPLNNRWKKILKMGVVFGRE